MPATKTPKRKYADLGEVLAAYDAGELDRARHVVVVTKRRVYVRVGAEVVYERPAVLHVFKELCELAGVPWRKA